MLTRTQLYPLLAPAFVGAVLCSVGCETKGSAKAPSTTTVVADFRDATAESGIHYRWEIPAKRPLNILQTIGNGCAFLDFNQDEKLDILLVGPQPALYQGDGAGKFTDATPLLGGAKGHFLGCAVGDVDNDGFPDIYLSGFRDGRLLQNQGGKGFKDVTITSGIKPQPWGTSCAFVETKPGSGKLDLVIANYARFGPEQGIKQLCDTRDKDGKMVQTSCGPRDYEPIKAVFYQNQGGMRFTDASSSTGFNTLNGRGLGVAACVINDSGRPSINFANDEIGGDLLRWENGKPKNVAELSGTAYDRDGNVHGGMGTAWGDYDNDGRFDLVVSTYQNEPKSVYHNDGEGLFTDVSYVSGVGVATLPYVAFGTQFFDYDNDGWLDLIFANGHVQDNIEIIDPKTTYRQSAQLFRNKGEQASGQSRFEEVTSSNPALQKPMVGRGLASGDYDNDGRMDVLIVDSEGEPLLLHNESKNANPWLGLKLVGSRSNRDGYGAQVTVEAGGKQQVRHCHADGSYLSSSDSRVHFGLGTDTAPPKITIRWPSGSTQTLTDVKLGQYTTVTEAGSPK